MRTDVHSCRSSHEYDKDSVTVRAQDEFGRTVTVTVRQIRAGTVRLGFEGPRELELQRLELWTRSPGSATLRGRAI